MIVLPPYTAVKVVTRSTGPVKAVVAGTRPKAVAGPSGTIPEKPGGSGFVPGVRTGVAVKIPVVVSPTYGRLTKAGAAVGDDKAGDEAAVAETPGVADAGTSTSKVPRVPPGVGRRVRYCVVLPV